MSILLTQFLVDLSGREQRTHGNGPNGRQTAKPSVPLSETDFASWKMMTKTRLSIP